MSEDTQQNSKTPKIAGLVAVIVAVIAIGGYLTSSMTGTDTADTTTSTAADVAAETTTGEDVVIAKVNGEDIKISDAQNFVNNIPQLQGQPFEAIFPMVQEQLVSSRVVSTLADKSGLGAKDPEVAKRLALAEKEIIRTVFVENELAKAVTEEKLKGAYKSFLEKQPEVEEARARHILVETEDAAKALIAKLDDGADFVELAKESSTGPTGPKGGDLGYFTAKDMVPEFSTAAFALEKGAVTEAPVKTQFGYHVIKLEDKRIRPAPAYADVKPFLEAQERKEALSSLLMAWKGGADIEVFDLKGNEIEPASGE